MEVQNTDILHAVFQICVDFVPSYTIGWENIYKKVIAPFCNITHITYML